MSHSGIGIAVPESGRLQHAEIVCVCSKLSPYWCNLKYKAIVASEHDIRIVV